MDKRMSTQEKKEKGLFARIHGRVHGVGFRYSTQRKAQQLQLKGYVCNRNDGTVEVYAEGDAEKLAKLITWLKTGPPLSHVSKVDYSLKAFSGCYDSFSVTY